jgi:hypothetical protein
MQQYSGGNAAKALTGPLKVFSARGAGARSALAFAQPTLPWLPPSAQSMVQGSRLQDVKVRALACRQQWPSASHRRARRVNKFPADRWKRNAGGYFLLGSSAGLTYVMANGPCP